MVNNLFLAYFYYLYYELKEWNLVRFRDSLRPMLRNHILNETIYV